MATIKITGTETMRMIKVDDINNGIKKFKYDLSELMMLANRKFRFAYLFDKSITFSEVLKMVWSEAKRLMNEYKLNNVHTCKRVKRININPKHSLIID